MTMSPTAMRTARRNLVQAIDRFVRSVPEPTADQLANMLAALEALERADYPTGEDAIYLAERGWKPRFPPTEAVPSLAELVERFERLRAEE
jgi:hypothetical protein